MRSACAMVGRWVASVSPVHVTGRRFEAPRNLGTGNFFEQHHLLHDLRQARAPTMPGQFYARWVPPKSVTRQGAAARPQQTAPPYDSSPQRPKKQQGSSASSPPQSDLTGVGNDGEKKASEDTCKSPKPAKMSKRKRESNVDERDEATPKKHKAILSKFEKVARRAEAREAPVAVEGAEGEQEERPEQVLRGGTPYRPQPDTADLSRP